MATGTFAAYALGVLGPAIIAEFDLTRLQLGLATTIFFLVGGSLSLAAGNAVDRIGAKRVMLASFVLLGVALFGMATAPTYALLMMCAAVAGLGLAVGNPVTNKLVAINLPPGRRGITMGTKQAGVQLGAFLAGAALAPFAANVGWRVALGVSAIVPLLLAVAATFVIARDVRHTVSRPQRGPLPSGVRWLAAYAFLMGSGVATLSAYLPLYLVERTAATAAEAGAAVAVLGLVGVISRIGWGWASERLVSFSTPLVVLGVGAVFGTALVIAVESFGFWLAWPAAIVLGATAVTWNSVGMLAVLSVSGAEAAGRASGAVLVGFYIGFVASPVVFGWVVDVTDSYALAWSLVGASFVAAAAVALGWRSFERLTPRRSKQPVVQKVPSE
jgi:MFS family permease